MRPYLGASCGTGGVAGDPNGPHEELDEVAAGVGDGAGGPLGQHGGG